MGKILVVDDDASILSVIKALLLRAGHAVETAENGELALDLLTRFQYDILITDMRLPQIDGLTVVRKAKQLYPHMKVIVMTAYSDVDSALAAMRSGASDYLVKPFNFKELVANVDKTASGTKSLSVSSGVFRRSVLKLHYNLLVGESEPMQTIYQTIDTLAGQNDDILLYGAAGTGKALCARAIHMNSRRSSGPLVAVNCAAIPVSAIRKELFGFYNEHNQFRNGLLITADGGTILLENIESIPESVRDELARFIETRQFESQPGEAPIRLDIRIMISSSKSELAAINQQTLSGLYEPLSRMIPVKLPQLSIRTQDIPQLVMKFLDEFELEERRYLEVEEAAGAYINTCDWRNGNLDLLRAVLFSASRNACSDVLTVEDIQNARKSLSGLPFGIRHEPYQIFHNAKQYSLPPFSAGCLPQPVPLKQRLRSIEAQYIRRVIQESGGNKEVAADKLGISLATLYRKLDEHMEVY